MKIENKLRLFARTPVTPPISYRGRDTNLLNKSYTILSGASANSTIPTILGNGSNNNTNNTTSSFPIYSPATGARVDLGGDNSYLNNNAYKLSGTAGLGAIIGMGAELFKLRRKILNRWERDKQKAREKGLPEPPRPDTSKGALMAMLKGAALGGAAGGALGFVPGIGKVGRDTAATIHAGVNRAISGSNLLAGNKVMSSFSDPSKYFDINDIDTELLQLFAAPNYTISNGVSTLGNGPVNVIAPINTSYTLTHSGLAQMPLSTYNAMAGANTTNGQQPSLSYAQKDKLLHGNSATALAVAGALGGGAVSAYRAWKRDLKLWEELKAKAEKEGSQIPVKPVLGDYLGDFVKGGIKGGLAGSLVGATGIGKSLNSKLNNKGIYVQRGSANKAIKAIQQAQKTNP